MLKLEGVTADLGGKRIIDGFSAEFAPGVYAIMAPSGRGKTTLLMDEPTRGLDEDNAGRVMDIACRYAAGKPLIFTTHSPFLAQRFADRIITL